MKMTKGTPRSIRFPKELWDAIDDDAVRCKRSSVKQMEAVLSAYYELENVELNQENLQIVGKLFPGGKARTSAANAKTNTKNSTRKNDL